MERATIIVLLLLLYFLTRGLFLLVVPLKVHHFRIRLLGVLRLIPAKRRRLPVRPRNLAFSRAIGGLYVAGAVLVLANMNLQVGKIYEPAIPARQDKVPREVADDSTMRRIVQEMIRPVVHKYVGLVVATIAGDETFITSCGRVDLNSSAPPDGKTLFEIGSISKIFTGILLAESIAKNQVSLDTTVSPLFPSMTIAAHSQKHRITLGHLVTHTSGLPRMPPALFRISRIWTLVTAADSYRGYTEEDVLELFEKARLGQAPGEHFSYSNVGFGLLGMSLSRLRGMNYHRMVETVSYRPLGLEDTGVYLDERQETRLAQGYRSYIRVGPFYLAQRAETWEFPDSFAGAGGLRSTASDMLTFLAANMGQERSQSTPVLMSTHEILFTNGDIEIGMAWFRKTLPKSGEAILWHNGETGGYSSFLGFSKNSHVGVVVLANTAKRVDGIAFRILDELALWRSSDGS